MLTSQVRARFSHRQWVRSLAPVALVAALAGCASGGTLDIYGDVLRGVFARPADATVTDEMLTNTPFAYLEVRREGSAQSVLVLGWQENGEDTWVSAGNELLILRHGRVVRTLGLPGDRAHTASAEADPLALVTSPEALHGQQWRSTLDWSGHAGAGFLASSRFHDHGMVTREIRAGETRTLRRVEEQVQLRQTGIRYSNWFYLDDDGAVVKSRQYVHPDEPPLTLVMVRPPGPTPQPTPPEPLGAEVSPDPTHIEVRLPSGQRLALPPGPQRLSTLLLLADDGQPTWWPGLRLYRLDGGRAAAARALREELVADLEALSKRRGWPGGDRRRYAKRAAAISGLVERLPPAPPGEVQPVVLDLPQLRRTPSLDVLLPPGQYLLTGRPRPEIVTLTGLVEHPGERGFVPGRSVAAYLAVENLLAGADADQVWVIGPEGNVAEVPVALWNREFALPQPGSTLLVGLAQRGWGRETATLDRRLAEFHAAQPHANAPVAPEVRP